MEGGGGGGRGGWGGACAAGKAKGSANLEYLVKVNSDEEADKHQRELTDGRTEKIGDWHQKQVGPVSSELMALELCNEKVLSVFAEHAADVLLRNS